MSSTRAQLVAPIGNVDANGGIIVSGVTTAGTFGGNFSGTATGLTGTPNLNVGVITATTFIGDGSNLTGIAATPFNGQNVTSVAGVTTINLSSGNVIYFTHNTDTTVAFANTSTTESLTFIRTKDDTVTPRSITWPLSFVWSGGATPTLNNNPRSTDAQQFNLLTRDGGETWYAHQEVNVSPNTNTLFSWGLNTNGQLGQNNQTYYSSPVQISGTSWSAISVSSRHSLATKTDNTLWAWGANYSGQLGQNNITYYSSPVQIPGTSWSVIDAGSFSSWQVATKTDGTLWAWGTNLLGQLGQNNTTQFSSPVQIPGTSWSSISGGGQHSLATKTDNTLWAWGSGSTGRLGQNDTIPRSSPVQIPGTTWSSISGANHSLATKTDGTLWALGGINGAGALGQNNTTQFSSPVQIPGTTWSSISSGYSFVLATKTDNTLWAWGGNTDGQLGQNNRTQFSSPVQIPGTSWSSIAAGYKHSLATKTDGTLWLWGQNNAGGLGQGNRTYASSPVQIPGTSWSSIAGGDDQSLALQITS
jgi:alpha-tubulin suppressor-like RCC1 family protein